MNATRGAVLSALAVALLTVSGCSMVGADPAPSEPDEGSSSAAPVGIIAIGHSGLTGENADPERQGRDARDQSWATGEDPAVDSIYLRMVANDSAHDGHVANTAAGGASASQLAAQAEAALEEVPAPALVIVQTVDNDIRCDGTDARNVAAFGEDVAAAMDVITTASPGSKILFVSQRGRPAMLAQYFPAAAEEPAPGEESCNFVNEDGEFVTANSAYLTSIIEAYEGEQARVCAEYPNCIDDGGAMTTFQDTEEDLAGGDGNHLTTQGQARTAALIWPVAAETLGY